MDFLSDLVSAAKGNRVLPSQMYSSLQQEALSLRFDGMCVLGEAS